MSLSSHQERAWSFQFRDVSRWYFNVTGLTYHFIHSFVLLTHTALSLCLRGSLASEWSWLCLCSHERCFSHTNEQCGLSDCTKYECRSVLLALTVPRFSSFKRFKPGPDERHCIIVIKIRFRDNTKCRSVFFWGPLLGIWIKSPYRISRHERSGTFCVTLGWAPTKETNSSRGPSPQPRKMNLPASGGDSH